MHNYTPPQNYERLCGVGVAGRSEVARLAKNSPSQALAVARTVLHPWYRCQALASIVEANPSHPNSEEILNEALSAAYSQSEPNRVASVAMWPLKQLIHINVASASDHTTKLLKIIGQEPHGLRRLGGLQAILISVSPINELRDAVLQAFLETAQVSHGWRSERIIDSVISVIAPYARDQSVALLDSRPTTRFTKASRTLLGLSGGPK